jgi:hypothetical protein
MYSVDIYNRVRRACLKNGMSSRETAQYFNKDRKTIAKMLRHALPPGYRRSEAPRRPTLDGYVGIIDEILCTDKTLIKNNVIRPNASLSGYETNMDTRAA